MFIICFASVPSQSKASENTNYPLTVFEKGVLERVQHFIEDSFPNKVRDKIGKDLPEFRLITTVENEEQPIRFDQSYLLENKPYGTVVTVHNRKTGAPLYSCTTPCRLNVDKKKKRFLAYYKDGYSPRIVDLKNYKGIPRSSTPFRLVTSMRMKDNADLIQKSQQAALQCLEKFNSGSDSQKAQMAGKVCNHKRIGSGVPGICKADFRVVQQGWVQDLNNVRCSSNALCLRAYEIINRLAYYPIPESQVTRDEMRLIHFRSGDEKGTVKYKLTECFPENK